ncbi:hypothetical protein [Hydrocarboniphaga sp.]|uniref:hypothetical protein n=1 Tax=Hydrocarboniphaga sp. TaxID=2033016 RepID=UPI003D120857
MKNPTPSTDYAMWKLLAWCGPIFMAIFFVLWGLLAKNFPPRGANLSPDEIYAHYIENGMAIRIGMSVCMVGGAFYMAWGCAVSKLMRRVEGPEGVLSNLELMGATATFTPILMACGIWLIASMEAAALGPAWVHMMYSFGWMVVDLAYMVTSFQIFAVAMVFMRDKREKPLMPSWVSWEGFITVASFFPVSLIPFFKSGPFAFHGLFNFWIAFPTWYIWVSAVSFYTIKAIHKLEQEEAQTQPIDDHHPQSTPAFVRG